jgi:hypothetical protein
MGKYTGLTAEDLMELMAEKPDWCLVTDVKDDVPRALRALWAIGQAKGVNAAGRIIPQIYSDKEESLIGELPYDRWILTIYRMGQLWEKARQIVHRQPKIIVMTIPVELLADERARMYQQEGVAVFVHTVNQPEQAKKLLGQGIGLYTDSYFQAGE